MPEAEKEASAQEEPKRHRTRRARKRTKFAIPKPAKSVKALWEQASEADRQRAHRYGTAILETWLGKKSRKDAAKDLGLPVLRVWQLSQQAVSGMLAGLLTQPRQRRSPDMPKPPPENDPAMLKKKIAKLERELEIANELIEVLKLVPDRPTPPPSKKPSRQKKKAKAAGKKGTPKKALPGTSKTDRGDGPATEPDSK